MIDPTIVMKYSDKILDLIDNAKDLSRRDLQDISEGIIMGAISDALEEKK